MASDLRAGNCLRYLALGDACRLGQLRFSEIINLLIKIRGSPAYSTRVEFNGFGLHPGELQALQQVLIIQLKLRWNGWGNLWGHLFHPHGKVLKNPFRGEDELCYSIKFLMGFSPR